MDVVYTQKFVKQFRKLPAKIRDLAIKKEIIFRKDPYDPRLKTHKLSGELVGRWSFSVNYEYRIVFVFRDSKHVDYLVIGTHEVYD